MRHSPTQAEYRANGPETETCSSCDGFPVDDCPECGGRGYVTIVGDDW